MKLNKNYFISLKSSVKEAISTIEKSGIQIALVVKSGKLIGTVTDGDVRRAFLNKSIKLEDSIQKVVNKDFKFLYQKDSSKKKI